MRKLKEKSRRIVKYWWMSFKQASERDRLLVGAFALMALTYLWWGLLTF